MTSWGSSHAGREDENQLIKARESMGKLTCLRLYRPYDLWGLGNARKEEFPDCTVEKSNGGKRLRRSSLVLMYWWIEWNKSFIMSFDLSYVPQNTKKFGSDISCWTFISFIQNLFGWVTRFLIISLNVIVYIIIFNKLNNGNMIIIYMFSVFFFVGIARVLNTFFSFRNGNKP